TKATSCTGQTGDDAIKPVPAKATTCDDNPRIDKCGWSTKASRTVRPISITNVDPIDIPPPLSLSFAFWVKQKAPSTIPSF
ncbi:hypothetical protein, partial [Streptosporangium roseum]|uniref:hypothetical protein n=1 Tax=Streptosporangium roseum TaxID=2001 RepID=UPI00332CD06D